MAAREAAAMGRMEQASELCRQAGELDPTFFPAKMMLGMLYARGGQGMLAISALEEAVRLQPTSYEATASLANVYQECGNLELAAELGLRAISLRPSEPRAHYYFGLTQLQAHNPESALAPLLRAIQLQPSFRDAYHMLGRTYYLLGKLPEGAAAFERAAELNPSAEALIDLSESLSDLSFFPQAEHYARKAVALASNSARAHAVLAQTLFGLGKREEADQQLKEATNCDKDGSQAFLIGFVHRAGGNTNEANASFRRVLEKTPGHIEAMTYLIRNHKVEEADRDLLDRMQNLAQDPTVSPAQKRDLEYGLGKAFEDLEQYEGAMSHYDRANELARETKHANADFKGDRITSLVDLMISTFTKEALNLGAPGCSHSVIPLLVFGMMRSGTTLVEQVLSSHPKACGTGEQEYWMMNWPRAFSGPNGQFDVERIGLLAQGYLAVLQKSRPQVERLIDKLPLNVLYAGLIHLAFPNARMIHVRRSPIDNGLSIWTTPNRHSSAGDHVKTQIVFAFKQYLRVMEHWRALLPSNRFMEIDYEELVANPEGAIRRMVAFSGLEWNDACLKPEENARYVNTPSMWQIRQPIYRTSVERWRRFEPWLGELNELVDLHHPPTV